MHPTEHILLQPSLVVSPHLCNVCRGKSCLLPLRPESAENAHQPAERLDGVVLEAFLWRGSFISDLLDGVQFIYLCLYENIDDVMMGLRGQDDIRSQHCMI